METRGLGFPDGFLWGAATSAYQIEGHPLADGAGASIWDRFVRHPGRIANGDTGDLACDHYRRWPEDLELMARLGLQAYRFSVAWGRVLPQGRGPVNVKGLDFYRRLVDALLQKGIAPMITLYHWDLPAALGERGGWANPDSPGWLADYGEILFRALGDRVPLWVTVNEPWIVSVLGHLTGELAPGHRDLFETARVAHHLLLAHAQTAALFRTLAKGKIGIALNLEPQHPASPADDDIAAATRRDIFLNRWFLDPLLVGDYPPELASLLGCAWPEAAAARVDQVPGSADFIGVNYYSRSRVRADPSAFPVKAAPIAQSGVPRTAMGWEVYPEGLAEILLRLKNEFGNPPVYVTENGAAFDDPPPVRGEVADTERVDYLRTHLLAARQALHQGADLRGYFAWSLLDNFEWAFGYAKRFGLVRVDARTGARTPKASARFYRDTILTNGTSLDQSNPTEPASAD